jgi:hypothetical protein
MANERRFIIAQCAAASANRGAADSFGFGQLQAGGQQLFHPSGRGAGACKVETLGRRQFQQAQQVARLVGHPVVERLVHRAVAQHMGRRAVASELQRRAQRQGGVGLELDGPAAECLDALEDAQGLRAQVLHARIIRAASAPSCTAQEPAQNDEHPLSALEAAMERTHARKLKFEQAHPDDWDAFNGWAALPTSVTRAEAPAGCERRADSGACWWKGRTATG